MAEKKQGMFLEDLRVGMTLRRTRTVKPEDIEYFATATRDRNPIHFEREAAVNTGLFKDRIAHGLLTAGYISGIVGMEFPGPGCIFRSLSIKFLGPVYVGAKVTIILRIKSIVDKIVKIEGVCRVKRERVLTGEALLGVPRKTKTK